MKYENLALEIKNMWKPNNVTYPSVVSVEGVVTKNFTKCLQNIALTNNFLRVGQKAVLLQTCHIKRKFLGHAP